MKHLLVYKNFIFIIALSWTFLIAYLCLIPANQIQIEAGIPNIDKLAHFFFHFMFILLWFSFFCRKTEKKNTKKILIKLFAFSFLFGILIEFLQKISTTSRSASILDVLANILGAFTAVVIIELFYNRLYVFTK